MAVINTNILSMIVQANLRGSQKAMQSAMQRLSSGLRINSAKDDPAGQAIANRMTAQIRGLNQAARNASDGISLVQTAEGALNQVNDNLQRIRELTVQAGNDTLSPSDLAAIQAEIDQRLDEIDRVGQQTGFNGVSVLGENRSLHIQVGANDGETIAISLQVVDRHSLGLGGFRVVDDGSSTTTESPLDALDEALKRVDRQRSQLGALHNRFEAVIDNIHSSVTNLSAARSRIMDADYAREVSNLVRAQILQQVGFAILAQANRQPELVLELLRQR
ncbi:flagellin FliC [Billgrantia tianxiuensis]|uniref:Flagellin n=1 Tax=Billgrantia tianxiuensis TaxID=2497861 RepID=A0A6I6SMH2_9GAMM|nr:flagellin [Halomonas tianxiuensis]MCE8034523.1 flagellin FliC [Halomonas sp. MCCC 1A11057]QHC50401.1 flagellin FliC [Halomonas tianxiuensis]